MNCGHSLAAAAGCPERSMYRYGRAHLSATGCGRPLADGSHPHVCSCKPGATDAGRRAQHARRKTTEGQRREGKQATAALLVEAHSPEHGAVPPSVAWSTVKLQLLVPAQAITGASKDTSLSQPEPVSLAQSAESGSVGEPNTCSHRHRQKTSLSRCHPVLRKLPCLSHKPHGMPRTHKPRQLRAQGYRSPPLHSQQRPRLR
jgi:hypothetical protein